MFRIATPTRSEFTEMEAAEELGITVTELRALVRIHGIVGEDDLGNLPMTSYHSCDLVVLRMLSGGAKLPEE